MFDWLGNVASGIGGAISGAAGWVGQQVGGLFGGGQQSVGSLGQPVNLRRQLAQSGSGGSLMSRASDALGDVVEDVILPLGGALLKGAAASFIPGMMGPARPPFSGQTPGIAPGRIQIGDLTVYEPPGGAGAMPAPIYGPRTPTPSPTRVSFAPTAGAVQRSQATMAGALALPGGAAIARAVLPRALQALGIGVTAAGAMQLFEGGGNGAGIGPGGPGTSPYIPTQGGYRAARHFVQVNPVTGKLDNFGSLGPCILFSRDLSGAKKVKRLAARARRATRGR